MTKYILHGGALIKKSENNKKFFAEIVKGLPKRPNILCIYFSREKRFWPGLFKQDKINFSFVASRKVIDFVLAADKISALVEQIKKANAIYMFGGSTASLIGIFGKVANLKELYKGKVVAGESAGANMLSKYYYSNSQENIRQGLGLLPIKTFCHYGKEKSAKLEKLKKYGGKFKVYAIPEEKFVIIKDL